MTAFALPLDEGGTMPELVRQKRHLQPGQLFVAQHPTAISTIVGSCVAVCLWDASKSIGGMNHFMLPIPAGAGITSPRFGNVAMEQLVTRLRDAGARLPMLRARVYGGACMFAEMKSPQHIGRQNADLAIEFLRRSGIEIVEIDTGGNRGRKLIFHTDGGAAWLTLI
jgi:chemotaxis protein CheD